MHEGGPICPKRGGGADFNSIFCISLLVFFAIFAVLHFLLGNTGKCFGELFLVLMEICFLREHKFDKAGDKTYSFLYAVTGVILGLVGNYLILFR